jgi:hypothetical protein
VPRIVAIFGVQGWRWDWVREVLALVFVLDAATVRQQQWRELAHSAVLPADAYGGHNDVNEAWGAGPLAVDTWCTPAEETGVRLAVPADLYKAWEERVAIMLADGHLLARLAWEGLQGCPPSSRAFHAGHDSMHA